MNENNSLGLFNDDVYDAARDCVKALGGFKKVGFALFPEKGPEKAGNYLGDCLDRRRGEKLSLEHFILILKWARHAGCHIGMNFICLECDYREPEPVPLEEKTSALEAKIDANIKELSGMLDRYAALRQPGAFATIDGE